MFHTQLMGYVIIMILGLRGGFYQHSELGKYWIWWLNTSRGREDFTTSKEDFARGGTGRKRQKL